MVAIKLEDQQALDALEERIRTLLPAEYQDSYEELQPVPMRSAGLKYGPDGKVAWNEIWGGFCDLAMAGGPPHKGTLLLPGTPKEIEAEPARSREVAEEICRGITLAADLGAGISAPGWVRVECLDEAMAGWLVRAIVMENVAARASRSLLDLPAAPHFQIGKEIKNVVTVIAKTSHYWLGHMPRAQRRAIGAMFADMAEDSPLLEPAQPSDDIPTDAHDAVVAGMASMIPALTGRSCIRPAYVGWLGVQCPSVRAAIWMMRAMVANNVLSRREGTILFLPVSPASDSDGEIVARTFARVHELAKAKGAL